MGLRTGARDAKCPREPATLDGTLEGGKERSEQGHGGVARALQALAKPELTDAEPHNQAAGEQRLLLPAAASTAEPAVKRALASRMARGGRRRR